MTETDARARNGMDNGRIMVNEKTQSKNCIEAGERTFDLVLEIMAKSPSDNGYMAILLVNQKVSLYSGRYCIQKSENS